MNWTQFLLFLFRFFFVFSSHFKNNLELNVRSIIINKSELYSNRTNSAFDKYLQLLLVWLSYFFFSHLFLYSYLFIVIHSFLRRRVLSFAFRVHFKSSFTTITFEQISFMRCAITVLVLLLFFFFCSKKFFFFTIFRSNIIQWCRLVNCYRILVKVKQKKFFSI